MYVRILVLYIHTVIIMPKSRSKGAARKGTTKVSRTFRITQGKVEAAQEILGTETATATIETALDMVLFRQELIEGTAALRGALVKSVG